MFFPLLVMASFVKTFAHTNVLRVSPPERFAPVGRDSLQTNDALFINVRVCRVLVEYN